MTLNEQLSGNFPKTFDKNSREFSALVTNADGTGALQKVLTNLLAYMKAWCATPSIYDQTGSMLNKTLKFFSYLERFVDESDESIKNRFSAIFVRNHDTKWGTPYDIKNVFRQYFPSAVIYLVENTNKIDSVEPDLANMFQDGDISSTTPAAWTRTNCIGSQASRFSKAYGMEMNQSSGNFYQTVTIPNRKKINDTEPYEYKNLTYFLHFFLSGKINVQIYNSTTEKYWDDENKEWISSAVNNYFEKAEWDDCSLYFITEGDDDTADIKVTFFSVDSPVHSELTGTNIKGTLPVTWTLDNCTTTGEVITLGQSDSKVSTTATVIASQDYNLKFSSRGRIAVTVKNNNNKYWSFAENQWKSTAVSNTFTSSTWTERALSFTTESGDSSVTVSFTYINAPCYLESAVIEGMLTTTETLTHCTESFDVISMDQFNSVASYEADVESGRSYDIAYSFKGRCAVVIQNDNNEYWDINTKAWKSSSVKNVVLSNDRTEKTFTVDANADTTNITVEFSMLYSYLDYFRLFQKQAYSTFTVIAHFEGYSATGVFGLAAGDADPNMTTTEETPPQPRYGNYGYYDKSFLSGVPIGFAKDVYEDLLDYLRAQGVRAFLDIVIRDYVESE